MTVSLETKWENEKRMTERKRECSGSEPSGKHKRIQGRQRDEQTLRRRNFRSVRTDTTTKSGVTRENLTVSVTTNDEKAGTGGKENCNCKSVGVGGWGSGSREQEGKHNREEVGILGISES